MGITFGVISKVVFKETTFRLESEQPTYHRRSQDFIFLSTQVCGSEDIFKGNGEFIKKKKTSVQSILNKYISELSKISEVLILENF